MLTCPLDTCRFNEEGICSKETVVLDLKIRDDGSENLLCKMYIFKKEQKNKSSFQFPGSH
jgi:hypothetical protein